MTFSLSVRDRSVLLLGSADETLGQAHSLVADGARVSVCAAELPTSLLDLAQRGLIAAVANPDLAAFDLVIRPADTPAAAPKKPGLRGRVTLVGGGPGNPGLLTVAGLEAIRSADVIICDRLAPLASLEERQPGVPVIDVGKIPRGQFTSQEQINQLILEYATKGQHVVRFKGGDNFVFGRGGEEAMECVAQGFPVEVIPGVTSAVAGPALAGIPVTHRNLTQGFTVISGHAGPGDPRSSIDWTALTRVNTTLVILMGVATLGAICERLITDGMAEDTPAAVIADAALPSMRVVRGTVSTIAELTHEHQIGSPATTVIGAVAGLSVLEPADDPSRGTRPRFQPR